MSARVYVRSGPRTVLKPAQPDPQPSPRLASRLRASWSAQQLEPSSPPSSLFSSLERVGGAEQANSYDVALAGGTDQHSSCFLRSGVVQQATSSAQAALSMFGDVFARLGEVSYCKYR